MSINHSFDAACNGGIFLFIAILFCTTGFAQAEAADSAIKSVTPDFIKMRHSETLQITVEKEYYDNELSVIPGGIFIEQQLDINTNKFDIFWHTDQIAIASNRKSKLPNHFYLQDGFKQIASNDMHLAVAQQKTVTLYNKSTSALKEQLDFKQDIEKIALSKKNLCVLLSNQQLSFSALSNETNYSVSISGDITALAAYNNHCITANKSNEIQLWQIKDEQLVKIDVLTLNNRVHKIIAHDNLLLIANGNTGLSVLAINNNKLSWKSSYNKLGNIINIANDDSQVLVADDEGILTLIDISGLNRPLLISDFFLKKKIHALLFKKGKAYVKTASQLIMVDFAAQSSPLISTLGVNQGGSRRSYIDGDILYVADWFSGLHLYDISLPHSPRLISSFQTPGSPKGVLVRNGIAYIADDDHGLQIVNVTIPQRPKLISNLPLPGLAYTMKLRGNKLFLASHYGGFHIIDVANASKPRVIGSVNTPGKSWALALKNNELYVADDQTGLLVFDINKPDKPTLISQFNPGGFAEDIVIRGNRAYLAFFDLGLFILDISDAKNIRILSRLNTPGSARGIEIHGNTLYLASWEAGVALIDISDELTPKLVSQYDTDGATWGLSAKNNMVYAMDWWGGIKIIDANDALRLRQISKYHSAGKINDIALQKNFLYTAHGARGLQIYESSNALNPVWASGVDIIGNAHAVAVNNGLVLIASGNSGIDIVDISNSFQPRWLSKLELHENVIDVVVNHKTAIALTNKGSVFIIDLTRPAFPDIESRLLTKAKHLEWVADSLWCLTTDNEIQQFDLANLPHVILQRRFTLPEPATQFSLNNDSLIVAQNNKQIARFSVKHDHIELQSAITLSANIVDMILTEEHIYISTDNRMLNVIKNRQNLQLKAQYPSTHRIENIAADGNSVYFSGESLIASGQLLPQLKMRKTRLGFELDIPKNMPLGTYHLAISNKDGSQAIKLNAFEVGFPKFKPKFSMDDLKKKLKEKSFSGKAPAVE